MAKRQVKEAKRQEEEALAEGKIPEWWRSGITGTKRARLEEEEEEEEPEEPEDREPRRRKRRRQ